MSGRRVEQKPFEGPNQRGLGSEDHDRKCDRRIKPLWSIIAIMLIAFVINGAVSYSQNEGMKSKNATQDVQIEHIEKNFEKIESRIDGHHKEQVKVNNKILDKLDELNNYMRDHDH